MKPKNPYTEGTIAWAIFEGDWEDLTIRQIAEVLDIPENSARRTIEQIKAKTGYDVPRTRAKRGRKKDI